MHEILGSIPITKKERVHFTILSKQQVQDINTSEYRRHDSIAGPCLPLNNYVDQI
jgi:hypothetical protein